MLANSAKIIRTKFCWYHQDHGHNTDKCQALERILQELKAEGKLGKYLSKDKEGTSREKEKETHKVEK